MDECKGLIVCKNRIKYRTDVAISADNMKDVGCLAQRYVGLELMLLYSGFIENSTSLVLL